MPREYLGRVVAGAAIMALAGGAFAQCEPAWERTIGAQGLGSGYAGPIAAWDPGTGEQLFVGGSFTSVAGQVIRGIGRWDPMTQAWSPVAGGCYTTNTNYYVAAIGTYDAGAGSRLVVGGFFATAGGVGGTTNLAMFDGGAWSAFPSTPNSAVWSLASWNGSLYVGGGFSMVGTTSASGIAQWNGKAWDPVGSGMSGGFAPNVFALRVYDDGSGEKLYAAGRFASIGGASGLIGRWTGSVWESVGSGIQAGGTFSDIEAMTVFDDGSGPALYVGGSGLRASGQPQASVMKWNGVSWSAVGQDLGGRTTSLAVFDDGSGPALYAAGTAQPAINYFAKLANGQWTPAFGGVGGTPIPPSNFPSAFGLYTWGDRLVVGGNFTQVGDGGNGGGAATGIAFVRACPTCSADFNADGVLNSQDFFDYLTAFFGGAPNADFNHDGTLNSQDFFDFLAVFFAGC